MSDMKLIMESWRVSTIYEGTETVGDLIKVIKGVKRAKAGQKGLKAMVKLVPVLGQLPDWADFLEAAVDLGGDALGQALYGGDLSDKKQPAGLQSIAIDPDVSRIVDDDIEKAFLTHLSQLLEEMPPETPINNVDTTALLQDFIASNFNNKTVKDS